MLKFYFERYNFKLVQNINYWLHQLRQILYVALIWICTCSLFSLGGKKKKIALTSKKKESSPKQLCLNDGVPMAERKPILPLPRLPPASSPEALPQPWPCACPTVCSSLPTHTAVSPRLRHWGRPTVKRKGDQPCQVRHSPNDRKQTMEL